MTKITNLLSATKYLYEELKTLNPDVDEDEVYDTIVQEVLESMPEDELSDHDIQTLEKRYEDKEFVDAFLQKKIKGYAQLLEDIIEDMLSEEDAED